MSNLAEIRGLDFAFGQQLVLKHIDLPIAEQSTLGLIGPNGGGKTTLLRLLSGELSPTRGDVRICGLSPREAVGRGDLIGYLPQNYAINTEFPISVRQLARLGLVGKTGLFRAHGREDLVFVDWLIERMGMAELAGRPIGALSGGQRQRAMIARALAARPKLLLLDEPTTGIDRSGQERFVEFISGLKQELKLTVVLVSHDLQTVSALADRIACLNVTLHYHDIPGHVPADVVHRLFGCSIEAAGLGPVALTVKGERK